MTSSVEAELKMLLTFFGEKADSSEAPKATDFFGQILSFSSSLQVRIFVFAIRAPQLRSVQKAALEVHDAEQRAAAKVPVVNIETTPEPAPEEQVRYDLQIFPSLSDLLQTATVKKFEKSAQSLGPPPSSQGRAAGLSVGRGDLDQAIRSMRTGKRRARPQRPVNKIFVDGSRTSRIYE